MKRFVTGISLLSLVSIGLVTGCSTASNSTNQAANTSNSVATNTTGGTGNTAGGGGNTAGTTGSNAANTSNSAGSGSAAALTNSQMKTIAKSVMDRYLQSHNDKTAAEYKVDITQILIPGLAAAVASSAQSGVDYDHPIKSSTVDITTTQEISQHSFQAKAQTHIEFADGKSEDMLYHLVLSQDQSNNQWLIRAIG